MFSVYVCVINTIGKGTKHETQTPLHGCHNILLSLSSRSGVATHVFVVADPIRERIEREEARRALKLRRRSLWVLQVHRRAYMTQAVVFAMNGS